VCSSDLKAKLKIRNQAAHQKIAALDTPQAHPLFEAAGGEIEAWEVGAAYQAIT